VIFFRHEQVLNWQDMQCWRFLVTFFFWTLSPLGAMGAQHLMVTAFEPFNGANINRSLDTANALKKELALSGIVVDICVIPVEFDVAAQKAEACYQSFNPKPTAALSLGEGDCSIRMETAAQNRDSASGAPDNAGNIRTRQVIEKNGPPSIAFGSFVVDMYCSLPFSVRDRINISDSPGGFVCNNTAFHLGNYFRQLKVPYTFIHVPNNTCSGNDGLAVEAGRNIAAMVQDLLTFNFKVPKLAGVRTCTHLPTTVEQVDELLRILSHEGDSGKVRCETEFAEHLKERLSEWKNTNTIY
jgi:pyrrolidone-carboxylate peptidase